LTDIYDHLQFLEKQSDLFHFFQTNELNKEASLGFFRKELSKQFEQLTPMKDTSYSMFASYYFKGNHLLCHDDVV
jgi:Rps23 Pro-64 3,4-dihydroxylase Tpa1-like proline 4-hydroxylase